MPRWAGLNRWWRALRRPAPLGQRGERLAERFLRRQGYVIVERAHRAGGGELDLVAVDGRTVVFVEVKTRRSDRRGDPAEAVDRDKRRRVTRAALAYLKRHELLEYPCRFDVVAIVWPADGKPQLTHYRDAFEAEGDNPLFS